MKYKLTLLLAAIILILGGGTSSFAHSLWATGDNSSGELSLGPLTTNVRTPQFVSDKIIAISSAGKHSMYIKEDNTLWATGLNDAGQLGDGTTVNRSTAVLVATDVVSVSCGGKHSLYIKKDGGMWATGSNASGQLGTGSTASITTAQKIATDVIAISAGSRHSIFLKKDGTCWGMGANDWNQMIVSTPNRPPLLLPAFIMSDVSAIAAGDVHNLFLKKDGVLLGRGSSFWNQLVDYWINPRSDDFVKIAENVSIIAAGGLSTFYVKSDGTLFGTGQAGTSFRITKSIDVDVTGVSAGINHVLYSKKDNSVWSVGWNTKGQLGDGGTTNKNTPVKLNLTSAVALSAGEDSSYFLINAPRLSNLSVRTALDANQIVIVGFTMSGGAKNVLLRAAGPTLSAFGVPSVMADPKLDLYSDSTKVTTNDNWGGSSALAAAFQAVGSFAYSSTTSLDAALVASIDGSRTAHVSGRTGGVVLVEAYDAGSGTAQKFTSLAARNKVGTGANILIAGFTLSGEGSRNLLIRAVGPTLGAFGVAGTLSDPKVQVYSGSAIVAENDNWSSSLAPTFSSVGAFGLTTGSKDAALTVALPQGNYTVQVSGADGGVGEALVEIYELP